MDVATTPALQIDAIPLLARLSKDRVEALERHTTIRFFAAGERIFDEGEENPGRLYVVLDGEMSLCNRGKAFSTHTMDDYEIAAHGKNAVFGTISFLDGKPYSSSAYAKTPLTLAVLDFSARRTAACVAQASSLDRGGAKAPADRRFADVGRRPLGQLGA